MKERLLSKSRFKLGLECPTKLFLTGKRKEYADKSLEDPFLEALARGGFQVGELAKVLFPDGHEIETLDAAEALAQTNALLERESVVVFEGAFRSGDFFIRADVVRKSGTLIELFEVKSKSFDPAEEPFLTKNGKGISSTWKPYLYDVAFQKFVMARALPGFTIEAHLMLANKTAVCTVDGLNQMFPLRKEKGRMRATAREGLTSADVCPHVLVKVPVDDVIDLIWAGGFDAASDEQRTPSAQSPSFEDFAQRLADAYKHDRRLEPDLVSAPCKSCQFRCGPAEVAAGLKSGFAECWLPSLQRAGGTEADLDATVLGVWNLHHAKRKAFLSKRLLLQRDLSQDDLAVKPSEGDGGLCSEADQVEGVYQLGDARMMGS